MEYTETCNQSYKTDIIGKRSGLLTVKELVKIKRYPTRYRYFYRCSCDCGNEKITERHNITGEKPHTLSCGCLKRRSGANNPTWLGHEQISGRHWTHIKTQAKQRGIDFNISIEYGWKIFQQQNNVCALTGEDISLEWIKRNGKYNGSKTASLDRIDNTKGYVEGNVHWVHKDVNKMKMDFPVERFIEVCRKVAEHAA